MRALPQAFWGIPEELQRDTWGTAVAALNAIPAATLPSDKMDLLLHAVRQIELGGSATSEEDNEVNPASDASNDPSLGETGVQAKGRKLLGADDMFPVFVFVLSQADRLWVSGGAVVLRELLQHMSNPERQRWSASAYYGATLEAAISHILHISRRRK